MIRILATAFAALAGLAFGSFLNVCLSRWPEGESIVTPRSHCRSCGRRLAWWENVPLISWLALRGRCRTCNAWIGWRYLLVELFVGFLWASAVWQFSEATFPMAGWKTSASDWKWACLEIAAKMLLYWFLIALAVLDAEHMWLPNRLTILGIFSGLTFNLIVFYRLSWFHEIVMDCGPCVPPFFRWENFLVDFLVIVFGIFAAAFLILLIRWLYKLIRKREGIGMGDAKLMAMLAAWLGLEGALLSFFLGIALGSVVAIIALALPSKRTSDEGWALKKLPLGTFLCIGGIVSALWGQPIIAAYLRWAGF
ncbi:MAG TPA: prepilin peptidase [Terracidiphilus sp.]|nr:prepilin peptidase [Terracidiphilus sp.]